MSLNSDFQWVQDVQCDKYQMTKVTSQSLDIINIYRSEGAITENFKKDLRMLFNAKKATYLVGDFNLCFKSESSHPVMREIRNLGFEQMVKFPTHLAGRLIDHVHFFSPNDHPQCIKVRQQSPYFTDHDLLSVIVVS